MEVNQSVYLLDLPSEILKEIVDHLPFFAARKNLRLTCRRLYNLCNLEHFCRDEVIDWPKGDEDWRRVTADFNNSSRGCYNLIFPSMRLESHQVSAFFQQHGARVRYLYLSRIISCPGLFELITSQCEGLVSLYIRGSIFPTYNASQQNFVPRPSVTFLELEVKVDLLGKMSSDFCYQMPIIFPCVKHLTITWEIYGNAEILNEDERYVHSILKFASNFRHLQSLNVKMSIEELPAEVPQFPKLKYLRLHLNGRSIRLHRAEKCSEIMRSWLPVFISRFIGVNISSIKISGVDALYASDIMPLLNVVGLERLRLRPERNRILHLNKDDFEALVSSHLQQISFSIDPFAPWTEEKTENWALQANETVTDLKIDFLDGPGTTSECGWSLVAPFCTYFHGLVHLETDIVDDNILQRIFKYLIQPENNTINSVIPKQYGDKLKKNLADLELQRKTIKTLFDSPLKRNLRTLRLLDCCVCTENGFCGDDNITDLQNLELLEISAIHPGIIQLKRFQTAFRFPRLQYLRISLESIRDYNQGKKKSPKSEILLNLLLSCCNLEAVDLYWCENPCSTGISSIIQNMKHLNYVNVWINQPLVSISRFTYVNLNHYYWIDWEKLKSKRSFYNDQDLDRTVFISKTEELGVQIHAPTINSRTVDWIWV